MEKDYQTFDNAYQDTQDAFNSGELRIAASDPFVVQGLNEYKGMYIPNAEGVMVVIEDTLRKIFQAHEVKGVMIGSIHKVIRETDSYYLGEGIDNHGKIQQLYAVNIPEFHGRIMTLLEEGEFEKTS